MSDPVFRLGSRRTAETLMEVLVPLTASVWVWWLARRVLAAPTATRPLTFVELLAILGAVAAVFSWYTARQLSILAFRRPWLHVGWSTGATIAALYSLGTFVGWGFDAACAELGGVVLDTQATLFAATSVCQLNPVPDNPYLPGTLLRSPWDGTFTPPLGVALLAISLLTATGLRNVRVRPTRMGVAVVDELIMAAPAGSKAVSGGDAKEGVQACGNPTFWGEPCGQLYPASRTFEPGEWCIRCAQVYRKSDRVLSFNVVSLFTADIDVLNGLERLDATSWPQGEAIPPDARLSGQERWVQLGRIDVPDITSVGTMLQLVHEQLEEWANGADEEAAKAFKLAVDRSSRLSAWIWFGRHNHHLTYARPTERAVLAMATDRLRDLSLDVGEELVLQLDIGLLPLELRTGFRQTFLDAGRSSVVHNAKQDFWIPVTALRTQEEGLWVPRIEGDALRAWLSLDRMRPADVRGVTSPRPYVRRGAEAPEGDVPEGSLDLVRMPLDQDEPTFTVMPGASITEWEWMDARQIELLRQQPLVMVRS